MDTATVPPDVNDLLIDQASGEIDYEAAEQMLTQLEPADVQKAIRRSAMLPAMFSIQGLPFSLRDYPQMRPMYDNCDVATILYCCGRQVAKCIPWSDVHKIRAANGAPMSRGTLVPGAQILTLNDGDIVPGTVTKVWDAGAKPLLEITTRRGSVVRVSPDHRLLTEDGYVRAGDLTVDQRLAGIRRGGVFGAEVRSRAEIGIVAYCLGDGAVSAPHDLRLIAKGEEALRDACQLLADADSAYSVYDYPAKSVKIIYFKAGTPARDWLNAAGMVGKRSWEKTIPTWVFDLSPSDLRFFLSRLWSTDGTVKRYGARVDITYTSTSRKLAEGIRALLDKLGILNSLTRKEAGYRDSNGYHRCRDAYRIRVEGPEAAYRFATLLDVPDKPVTADFRHSRSNRDTCHKATQDEVNRLFAGASIRKLKLPRLRRKYTVTRDKLMAYVAAGEAEGIDVTTLKAELDSAISWDTIVSIESAAPEDTFDIEVEGTHNFVLDGIISHNSQNLARSQVYDMLQYDHFHCMYVAPLQDQARYYSTVILKEALDECPLVDAMRSKIRMGGLGAKDTILQDNVFNKAFSNGSQIRLSYAHTSADRARGAYADRIDFDEIQDHRIDNLGIITQSLTQSNYGFTRYTGTAKTTDNTIEHLRMESSQTEWAVKCTGCNHWNIPTLDGGVLKMIRAEGPCCAKCQKRMDVRTGQFVHGFPDRADSFLGIHVPQIMVPAIAENERKWGRLIHKVRFQPVEQSVQELLGIACAQGARLISLNDIKAACVLPPMADTVGKRANYVYVVSGVDWGVAEVTSFTVHVVIGITGTGEVHLLWAKRYAGFSLDEMLLDISKAHTAYRCDVMFADYGVGFDKNILLQTRFNLKVVMIQYTRQKILMTQNDLHGTARYMVDRTTSMEQMYYALKYGRVKFPPFDEMQVYVQDLLSPYLDITDVQGIETKRFFRDPSRPDDFAHALNFGLLGLVRLTGSSLVDLMPLGGMGADQKIEAEIADLERDHVNPYEARDSL